MEFVICRNLFGISRILPKIRHYNSMKGGNFMAQITKDTIIMDVLAIDPGTAEFFFEIGMHCLGCPSASGESIEQAAAVHGVDADALVEKINAYLASK